MDRIADFNISSNRQRHRNTNSCNVVINNNHSNSTPQFRSVTGAPSRPPDTVVYPSVNQSMQVEPNPYENTQVMERDVVIDDKEALNGNELDLYKTIAKTYGHILKDNNPKLVANLIDQSGRVIIDAESLIKIVALVCQVLIDQSGRVIIDAESLIKIVALVCQVQPESINIEYELSGGGCCAKINPIKRIEAIKVAGLDFKLTYNEKYNMLTDEYSVSLRKVLIPIEDLLP